MMTCGRAHIEDDLECSCAGRWQVRKEHLCRERRHRAAENEDLNFVSLLPHAGLQQGRELTHRQPSVGQSR